MEVTMAAIETMGTIDEHHQLQLDGLLPIAGPMRVRIIVLYPRSDEWDETEWLQAAARNPAFAFLGDSEEDIYSLADLATDLVIASRDADFAVTGLRVSSTLQLHRLMTATTGLIRRELGQLSPRMQI
jgi:hypothetical protein